MGKKTPLHLSLVAAVVFSLGLAAPALAQTGSEDEARAHFRLGRAHYDNGDFAKAAVEFESAYQISGRAALLYNIYLAYRDANNTPKAANALREYLEKEENIDNRAQLEARLKALESSAPVAAPVAAAAVTTAPEPAPEPAQAEPAQSAPEAATAAVEEGGGTNIWPYVVMGTGGAMVITSFITGGMASSKASEVDEICPDKSMCDSSNQERIEALQNEGQTLATVTDVLLFSGIAVAGAGVVWMVLDLTGSEDSGAPSASVVCTPETCGGSVSLSF